MSIIVRKGRKGQEWRHIKITVPGWRKGIFLKSCETTNGKTAREYHSIVEILIERGALDVLDALADGVIAFSQLFLSHSSDGVAGVRSHIRGIRTPAAASILLAEEVDRLLALGLPKSGKATQKGRYRAEIFEFIDAHGGPDKCTVDDLMTGMVAYYDHLIDGAVAERRAAIDAARQGQAVMVKNGRRGGIQRYSLRTRTLSPRVETDPAVIEQQAIATANRKLSALRVFAGLALTEGGWGGIMTENPASTAAVPRRGERKAAIRGMSRIEWALFRAMSLEVDQEYRDSLRNQVGEGWEAFVEPRADTLLWDVLTATGARTFSECVGRMSTSWLDTTGFYAGATRLVHLGGTKTKGAGRPVYVSDSLMKRIQARAEGLTAFEPIFDFTADAVRGAFYEITSRLAAVGHAQLGILTPYNLRHTYGRIHVEGDPDNRIPGVDLVVLMDMMGHKNYETTRRYAIYLTTNQAAAGSAVAHSVLGI